MKYQRRHYEDFAEILRVHYPKRDQWDDGDTGLDAYAGAFGEHQRIGREIIDLFARDNPRFDRQRFEAAASPAWGLALVRGEA